MPSLVPSSIWTSILLDSELLRYVLGIAIALRGWSMRLQFVLKSVASYFLLWQWGPSHCKMQSALIESKPSMTGHEISLDNSWDALGPFQIGTREAPWGADPLEYYGGFRKLTYDESARFPSSLSPNGSVQWSRLEVDKQENLPAGIEIFLTVRFPNVDWSFLQAVYGWPGLQYQAWIRGTVTISGNDSQNLLIYTDNVLEFCVDDQCHFGGDFYGTRRAPLLVRLDSGQHQFHVRIVRDVRAMGGVGEPTVPLKLAVVRATGSLVALQDQVLLPDIVDGKLPSFFGTISVRNEGYEWIDILDVISTNSVKVSLRASSPVRLAPGQSRPLVFVLSSNSPIPHSSALSFKIRFNLRSRSSRPPDFLTVQARLKDKSVFEPHKFTFLHPSGIVSYAVIRAPSQQAWDNTREPFPVLISLHGAGVEADTPEVAHSLDSLPDLGSWLLFPTGVTPWSSDDWHAWGFADVEAAVSAIRDWIFALKWDGPGVDTNKWLVTGHSNGGQGSWYALTHRPDNIIAGAPVSGYLSIPAYVPYTLWNSVDQRLLSLVFASISTYRHELLAENLFGIPLLQQHGQADDNVPIFHSRLMSQLLRQSAWKSDYFELPGKPHWFDGIMATKYLKAFFEEHLTPGEAKPHSSQKFSTVIPNPGDMGSRGGIVVDQLETPDWQGRVEVDKDIAQSRWTLKTSNIRRFHLVRGNSDPTHPTSFMIDRQHLSLPSHTENRDEAVRFLRSNGQWNLYTDQRQYSIYERSGRQSGTLDAFLRSNGSFLIIPSSFAAESIALEISRNFFQYFAADAAISDSGSIEVAGALGNVVQVVLGPEAPPCVHPDYPITIRPDKGISIRDHSGSQRLYAFDEAVASIFLRPLPDERLEVVVWGMDVDALRRAARLVPTMTGAGQPDFAVLSRSCSWKGVDGVLAMGFLDHSWNVSAASVLR